MWRGHIYPARDFLQMLFGLKPGAADSSRSAAPHARPLQSPQSLNVLYSISLLHESASKTLELSKRTLAQGYAEDESLKNDADQRHDTREWDLRWNQTEMKDGCGAATSLRLCCHPSLFTPSAASASFSILSGHPSPRVSAGGASAASWGGELPRRQRVKVQALISQLSADTADCSPPLTHWAFEGELWNQDS